MRIHATINERTLRRTFREQVKGKRNLIIIDRDLPAFGIKVARDGKKTFFVLKPDGERLTLGDADAMTAAQARERALATLDEAKITNGRGPLFADFAADFMRRRGRLWKPSTRKGNRTLLRRYLLPFFGAMRVADITRADVVRWFDSMSATPGNANRALPVLSVMMREAELRELKPQGSNPCSGMRRYRLKPRERFLSLEELKRIGFVLDHSEDTQAAAAIKLLLFTGARSSEITGLRWRWIRGSRAVLPDSKTGPKTIQLPPPARAVLNALPRNGEFVFPNGKGDAPMRDLGERWQKLRVLTGLEDVRLHDCRHTYASHAVMSGLDLYTVGRLLGHADIGSTERYAHLADGHVREAAGRISGIVHDAMTGRGKEAENGA